ncbi:MAG: cytochrome o ubiquinol oxidase subunit IV [Acetobacteraceae bacterium]|nr:cytochrome o ubiquinol oxidase subunit IV [Acetobacteraceae bacterium]
MSDHTHDRNLDDVGPGVIAGREETIREGVQGYLIGFVLSIILTVAAFYGLETHLIWGPGIPMALVVLAVAQIGVHLVFFLHITTDPDNTNNILALAFGVLIVVLLIGGSVWIMEWLNYRMMPIPMSMHM